MKSNTDQIAAEARRELHRIGVMDEDVEGEANRIAWDAKADRVIQSAIEKDREQRRDVLGWEQGYKCAKAELADDIRELKQLRAAHASDNLALCDSHKAAYELAPQSECLLCKLSAEQSDDTKRLDWCEQNIKTTRQILNHPFEIPTTLREAIDAAMRKDK